MSLIPEIDGYYWMRNIVRGYRSPDYTKEVEWEVWRIVNVYFSPPRLERRAIGCPGSFGERSLAKMHGVIFEGPITRASAYTHFLAPKESLALDPHIKKSKSL